MCGTWAIVVRPLSGRPKAATHGPNGVWLAFPPHLILCRPTHGNAFEAGLLAGKDLLSADQPPDVIFCLNDHIAFGAIAACTLAGLDVPADIGVVGFNGLPLASVLPVPLTTMKTPRREMGVMAARAILARRNGIPERLNRCLDCTLVPGATTRFQG